MFCPKYGTIPCLILKKKHKRRPAKEAEAENVEEGVFKNVQMQGAQKTEPRGV
jgi:hypothetical protein